MAKHKAKRKGLPKTAAHHSQQPVPWHQGRFSMRDEARHMSNHRSAAFDSSKKLRNMPIAFVSAGCLQGTVEEKPPQVQPAAPSSQPPPPCQQNPVAIDALERMAIRSPSPAPSTASASSNGSSEELIVFRGRGSTPPPRATHSLSPHPAKTDTAPSATPLATHSKPVAMSAQSAASTDALLPQNALHITASAGKTSTPAYSVIRQQPESTAEQLPPSTDAAVPQVTSAPPQDVSDIDSDTNSIVDSHFEKRRGGRPKWDSHVTPWVSRSKPGIGWLPVGSRPDTHAFVEGELDVDRRDAAMDDYMQNVEAFGLVDDMLAASSGFARREMDLDGGSHNDWSDGDEEPKMAPGVEPDDGWTSDHLRDLDDQGTSSDVEGTVAQIRRKRTRATGIQYLVVYQGFTCDDARWLPVANLTKPSDKILVENFEAKLLAREEQQMSSTSDSDSESGIDGTSSEDGEMDDEHLARALQKQEELGIDDDDLVLYAADEYFGGLVSTGSRGAAFDRPNKKRQQRFGGRTEPRFPSASAMADALEMDPYGGFDIMDTERPSLRLKKKGRRGQVPAELEDPDLNAQLQASWEADRQKKRLKKAEREELRRQGLLGRNGKGPDLSVKYKDGIDMDSIIEEIHTFMSSDMQTLSLPAMEAHRRAAIHRLVSELGVTSKSHGDGANRHTILTKTKRTKVLDVGEFDDIVSHKKYARLLFDRASAYRSPRQKKEKGAKARPTVSYQDGEIVGAKAPELGPENRGRALLEKMGWTKGMALGAIDNKGILQPIAHTVKITKAGLR